MHARDVEAALEACCVWFEGMCAGHGDNQS